MSNFNEKFGGGHNRSYGRGSYIKDLPQTSWVKFADFAGGYDSRDAKEDSPRNVTPNSMDMEVDRQNRIVPVPGVTVQEVFAERSVKQVALHASLDASSELVFFAPPYLGVKSTGSTAWQDIGLQSTSKPFAWTNFGSTLIFANGSGPVYARQPRNNAVERLEQAPQAATYASFAGRVFAGSVILDGTWESLGIRWSAANSDYRDWRGLGSGFELLIDDLTQGDNIVALRPMGLNMMAVILRKSIWIGRTTGLRDRPVDFQPRITGMGFVNSASVVVTRFGVMGLSDGGVYLFDGNTAKHVSAQIDADLLPLDVANLHKYHAAYNPVMLHYYLFTPTGLWVYDLENDRWFRRSLTADASVVFSQQVGGVTWAELDGSWASQQNAWMDYRPTETNDFQFMVVKRTEDGTLLAAENAGASSNYGVPMQPYWDLPFTEGQYANMLLTTQQMMLRYQSHGSVKVHLPDVNGNLMPVLHEVALPEKPGPHTKVLPLGNRTGLFTGARLEVLAGKPRISRVEFGVILRGPRIEGANFTPREYYGDFLGS